jgi:AcrR family transcriptional regulator
LARRPDPDLEARILKAAYTLWRRGGGTALTMRAVARVARTNTPAVYRRFRNRKGILQGLIRRIQNDLRVELQACKSIEEMGEAYVNYALRHPHEYDLFYAHVHDVSPEALENPIPAIRESRPNIGFMERKLAERLGGLPEDHTRDALALWAIAHGTAMMLIAKAIPAGHEGELRTAMRVAVTALLAQASHR